VRTFTIVRISRASSGTDYEVIGLTEWTDSFMEQPLGVIEFAFSIRGAYCECTGDYNTNRPTRNPACVHNAIYRTWRRQGRSGWEVQYPHTLSEPIAVYHVDDDGFLLRDNCGKITKLSQVDRVNGVEGAYTPPPSSLDDRC